MLKVESINDRYKKLLRWKMRFLFKELLGTIESECKKYNVEETFFNIDDNKNGYGKCRKILLDNGNKILDLNELILDQVEINPNQIEIKIEDKAMRDMDAKSNGKC